MSHSGATLPLRTVAIAVLVPLVLETVLIAAYWLATSLGSELHMPVPLWLILSALVGVGLLLMFRCPLDREQRWFAATVYVLFESFALFYWFGMLLCLSVVISGGRVCL